MDVNTTCLIASRTCIFFRPRWYGLVWVLEGISAELWGLLLKLMKELGMQPHCDPWMSVVPWKEAVVWVA